MVQSSRILHNGSLRTISMKLIPNGRRKWEKSSVDLQMLKGKVQADLLLMIPQADLARLDLLELDLLTTVWQVWALILRIPWLLWLLLIPRIPVHLLLFMDLIQRRWIQ